jgi:hypothetical protein
VNEYNDSGSYGLTSRVSNVAGTVRADTAPRFTGIHNIPPGLLPAAPAGGFPATPSGDAFAISWAMDSGMKTPYAHVVDLSVSRELSSSTALSVSYVGRCARRLPVQEDVAMPLDLVDPKSGMDYFTAATKLSKLGYANTDVNSVQPIPYWENLFGPLANGSLTATQVVYDQIAQNLGNETFALFALDLPDSQTGAGLNVPGHSYPSNRFYHDQYSALYAWRTIAKSGYNALQASLHHRFAAGFQGDFNYTWSKSLDWTSQAERIPTSGGNNQAQILNSWNPSQLRGISDFDATHQINANWLLDLPFGRGKRFGSNMSRLPDTLAGGWQLNGLLRWTSGLPFSLDEGSTWPTNWDIEGWAMRKGAIPSAAASHGSGAQRFKDPAAVMGSFRVDYPGESGTRNPFRGDGYFGLDASIAKAFPINERVNLRLRLDAFNVTNSVRFDAQTIGNRLDRPKTFGLYTQTLTQPRIMQVALRVEF